MAEFDAALVNGTDEGHQKSAEQIAMFVDADQSEPTPQNRDNWRSDFELRELEKPVAYDAVPRHWDWYADVTRQASQIAQSPSGKALLMLSQLNGERRVQAALPDHQQNWEVTKQIADDSRKLIDSLPSGARKDRLDSLLEYHLGLVGRFIGDYDAEIKAQDNARKKASAAGDFVGHAIADFSMYVGLCSKNYGEGTLTEEILAALRKSADRLVGVCTGHDPTQIAWRCYSAPVHVLQFHIWDVRKLRPDDEKFWLHILTEELPQRDKPKFDANQTVVKSIQAGLEFIHNRRVSALRLANEVETTLRQRAIDEQRPDARMTARLVMAWLASDQHLQVIADEGGRMHQMRSMARRVLDGKVRPWCTEHSLSATA